VLHAASRREGLVCTSEGCSCGSCLGPNLQDACVGCCVLCPLGHQHCSPYAASHPTRAVIAVDSCQVSAYDFSKPGWSSNSGLFSQMVWRDTRAVGCAFNRACPWAMYVCHYSPPGALYLLTSVSACTSAAIHLWTISSCAALMCKEAPICYSASAVDHHQQAAAADRHACAC
jgi:hypothetical protein